MALICVHVLAWTTALSVLKAGQGLHGDSTEAYSWGQQLLWGYGKHPPLTGWVAGLWFAIFPTTDWAMYALAMTVIGVAVLASWLLASRLAGYRRALIAVSGLMIYPIFNFKGFKYNPDLLQVPFCILIVLSFVIAFQERTIIAGVMLGFICAGAVLTKYWSLIVIGAIGIASLTHPDRARFFRSGAPYVAAAVFLALVFPHVRWLWFSDFASIRYASMYFHFTERPAIQAASVLLHHIVLLMPAAVALIWALRPWKISSVRGSESTRSAVWQLWVIVAVVVILPPVAAVVLSIHMKSDWGIPLYSLILLAFALSPGIAVPLRSVTRIVGLYLLMVVASVIIAPLIATIEHRIHPERYTVPYDVLANTVTQIWHARLHTILPVAAGEVDAAAGIAFYSPDHPTLFSGPDRAIATWIDPESVRRSGFVGVCLISHLTCENAVRTLAPTVTRIDERTLGVAVSRNWIVFLSPPER